LICGVPVQFLLGIRSWKAVFDISGIEVDDALNMAEQLDL
jgi:hypothetical protein